MPSFLQKLFRKKAPPVVPAATPVVPPAPAPGPTAPAMRTMAETSVTVPQVAVARLSLLPILQKLPEDLRQNVINFPAAEATVALPLSTIQKQLAAGSVKMSLASLYRQAPGGTFGPLKVEEKRMVEVPLSEVLRHVQPEALRRRADQRRLELPRSAPQLFGDRANPFAIAPSTEEDFPEPDLTPKFVLEDEPETAPAIESKEATPPLRFGERPAVSPRLETAPAPLPDIEGNVSLAVAVLYGEWPEPVRSEAASVGHAHLEVPARLLAAALAKGKAVFTWGQVRGWFTPPLEGSPAEHDNLEILLPLKVVAPAFLAHSRPAATRREVDLDATIPALFNGGEASLLPTAEPESAEPAETAASNEEVVPEPLASEVSAPLNGHAAPAVLPTPALAFKLAEDPEPAPAVPNIEAELKPASPLTFALETPATAATPALPSQTAVPSITLGTLFGKPDQQQWSPLELVDALTKMPGVAGAIVALREGLVVAARLPEHMKGDTVAAFLPQIFARLNNYAHEMQMGEVQDVLLTTNGAHFQGYCLGDVYFAVLGIAGEALPWEALRLVLQELQSQSPR